MIHFPSLGIIIKDDMPKEEVQKLCDKYPAVKKAVDRLEAKAKPQPKASSKIEAAQ